MHKQELNINEIASNTTLFIEWLTYLKDRKEPVERKRIERIINILFDSMNYKNKKK
jgi:hypothetical protein